MNRKEKIMKRLQEHYDALEAQGYNIVALFLQGSQNYNLDIYTDDYQSDIDSKAIVLPSLNDIVLGKSPESHTHVLENDEHIDIKDVRTWVEMWKKQNISYLEILFTEFCIINPKYKKFVDELLTHADEISRFSETLAVRCMLGMCFEKEKALEHPYPATLSKIEKYGYDPKQLHHIIRLENVCRRYINGESLRTAYIPDEDTLTYLREVKCGLHSLEEARELTKEYIVKVKGYLDESLKEHGMNVNTDVSKTLDTFKYDIIKFSLTEELKIEK